MILLSSSYPTNDETWFKPKHIRQYFFFVFLSDFYLQLEFFIYLFIFLKAEFHEEIHFGCPT